MSTRLVAGSWFVLLAVSTSWAQSLTAFTYQGLLKDSGSPANGAYDFRFSLFDAASGGTQVGADQFVDDLNVQNGLFTTGLDFGSVWDGSDRWLEIGVRPGSSTGEYTTLSPRVKINPTPYAAFAQRPWQTAGSAVFYNDGNVGIGTNAPAARLSLGGGNANTKLALWQGGSAADVMGFGIGPDQFRLHLHNPANRFSFLDAPNGSELLTILGNGLVGINTTSPESRLHVFAGSAGAMTAAANSVLTLEHNTSGYLSLLTPDNTERGVLFGQPSSNVAGGIIYNNSATPNGLQLRTNGNATRMVIDGSGNVGVGLTAPVAKLHIRGGNLRVDDGEIQSWGPITLHPDVNTDGDDIVKVLDSGGAEVMRVHSNGNVGIGTTNPFYPLHVQTGAGDRAIVGYHTATTGNVIGVFGTTASTAGAGVYGLAPVASGPNYGVYGRSESTVGVGVYGEMTTAGWGVWGRTFGTVSYTYGVTGSEQGDTPGHAIYAQGSFAASGTKSFQMDHPLSPETHYLNHFCTEGPEPYNAYSGNVVTDAQGYATVQLPDYFESINRDFRYQLTVIDDSDDFVLAKVVRKIQNNQFVIRTSMPYVEVSWRVEAVRNDRWVQQYGFQTEQEKEDEIKGKYLNPELFGQPKEYGIHYRPEVSLGPPLPEPHLHELPSPPDDSADELPLPVAWPEAEAD